MDDAPETPTTPATSPYGPPAGAIPPAASAPMPAPAPAPAPAPQFPPPAPYSLAAQTPGRPKNGFGVTSVWVGSFALFLSLTARGSTPFGVLVILVAATFGVLALVNARRLGKPRVAAVVGTSLTAVAVLATVFWVLVR